MPATGQPNLSTGYDHDARRRSNDGTAQLIGFVEFSNYNRQDAIRLQELLAPGITGTLGTDATR